MAPLKQIKQATLKIFVDGTRNTTNTFMPLVEGFVEGMPEWRPEVWDITEPFKRPFSIQNVKETISSWPGAQFNFDWKRKSKPKAWGTFSRLYWGGGSPRHAFIAMYADIPRGYDQLVVGYLRHAATEFASPYCYFDALVDQYKEVSIQNGVGEMSITGRTLQKCLPNIFWSQVFGSPYVRLFGLEKLLSAPAYKVEQLGPETVYIQLSESLFDMHERYEAVDAIRQQVKTHLDDNIFFKTGNPEGHVYRTPDFQFPPDPNPVPLYSTVMAAQQKTPNFS
ncbi:MAG TPA: hypothetical protein VJ654_01440 [Noviherbaspirillum sp.]|nr:hypothetical protein [Noviherbaspirillum sp.]